MDTEPSDFLPCLSIVYSIQNIFAGKTLWDRGEKLLGSLTIAIGVLTILSGVLCFSGLKYAFFLPFGAAVAVIAVVIRLVT